MSRPPTPLHAAALRRAAFAVALLAQQRGVQVATAESCTGGRVAAALTALPGSSRFTPGGVVSYANEAKTLFLGVDPATIAAQGAVSEPVAVAMAQGLLDRLLGGRGCAVSITGVAGPDGGTVAKPVGTVWFALAVQGPQGPTLCAERHRFLGGREDIQLQASHMALALLASALARWPAPPRP